MRSVSVKKHWPLIAAFVIYWAAIAGVLFLSIRQNHGHLVYPVDDTYIHMAIAKNLVLHGVWGITPYEFTSSTSSPLWTFLLSLVYFMFGVNEAAPLVMNVVFGTLIVLTVYALLQKQSACPPSLALVVLVLLVFVTPLPALTIAGMEHTLHALITLLFVHVSATILSSNEKPTLGNYVQLLMLAPLLATARYEGLFTITVVAVLFIFSRKLMSAVALGGSGALPIIVYGMWSTSHGWYFLPNSVLLKGNIPTPSLAGIISLGRLLLNGLSANAHILLLLVASLVILLRLMSNASWDYKKSLMIVFVGTTLMHMQFAQTGWFFRYEAYLMSLGIFCIGAVVADWVPKGYLWRGVNRESLPQYMIVLLLLVIFTSPFVVRAWGSLRMTPQATNNIYEQQYQMGLFLNRYYQGKTIAVNDIGAISYLADVKLLDLWGLGTVEIARLKLTHNYGLRQIESLTGREGVDIAIVYDSCYIPIGGLPSEWDRVGEWTVQNNVILGGDTVAFYAANPSGRGALIQNLKEFASELPKDVGQRGEYTDD